MNTTSTGTPRPQSGWQRFLASLGRLFGRKQSKYGDWLENSNQPTHASSNTSDDFMRMNNVDANNQRPS